MVGDETLGPVLTDALLPIPPVGLMYKLLGPVLMYMLVHDTTTAVLYVFGKIYEYGCILCMT